jgi:predicted GIY-YIG superfamily endonuclease
VQTYIDPFLRQTLPCGQPVHKWRFQYVRHEPLCEQFARQQRTLKQLTRQQKIQRGYASSWNIVLLEIYNLRMQVLLECCYIRMGNLNRKVEGISSHLSFDFDLPSSSVKVKVKVWSTNLIWVDTIQKNHQTIRLERNLKKLRLKNWTIFFSICLDEFRLTWI